jgi:hypothetical protein
MSAAREVKARSARRRANLEAADALVLKRRVAHKEAAE